MSSKRNKLLQVTLIVGYYMSHADAAQLEMNKIDKQVQADRSTVLKVFSTIKNEYIEPINSGVLIEACRLKVGLPPEETDTSKTLSDAEVRKRINQIFPIPSDVQDSFTLDQRKNDCLEGFVSVLDKKSAYFDEEEFKEMTDTNVTVTGSTGIELEAVHNGLRVIRVFEDSPAQAAGIQKDDVIRSIDDSGENLSVSIDKSIELLRGGPGTTVKLGIDRPALSHPISIVVERRIFEVANVKSELLKNNLGYFRLINFGKGTAEELVDAINQLQIKNKKTLTGVILDLRDNAGGLLYESVGVAAVFLPRDKVVANIKGRSPDSTFKITTHRDSYIRSSGPDFIDRLPPSLKLVPIVVLVNSSTAGAAEMISGALQDHKRATIMGIRSSAAGTTQTILPTSDKTALKLSTAKIFTPQDRSLNETGITPDVLLEEGDWIKAATEYLFQVEPDTSL